MNDAPPGSLGLPYFPYGYSLSDKAWRAYQFASIEAGLEGMAPAVRRVDVARALALRINSGADLTRSGAHPARAGELLAMGLLSEILRYLAERYCTESNPGAMARALEAARADEGRDATDKSLPAFIRYYPPGALRGDAKARGAYLTQETGGRANVEVAAQELLLLHVTELNPALLPYAVLYQDGALYREAPVRRLLAALERFFRSEPPYPETGMNLYELLRAPAKACPDSIEAQINFIRQHWSALLPQDLMRQLVLAADIIKEETALRGHGPGEAEVLEFGAPGAGDYAEPEAFSMDKDWMPNLVLLAKTTYVWLDQLSKQYGRSITKLDHIPDEELDRLASWGFSGLWLIGLWERSNASQKIKQMTGNPEAAASAYSLYDYQIADDLGGETAYQDLARRAWQRGIRLASDMVPNHVGIYSKWVVEHPHWFVQSAHPPFPSYTFNGPDLSEDGRCGLYLEDGYWEQRDAAVVFKRVDHETGAVTYIYHGNDGTNMPWNDTAQLNFLLPEVREAVIQTILHVARHFPVIRFDAAMTLAKKHFQRLWYPQPGDAGAIPSRAEHGMSRAAFDEVFPAEFWREVVDRVAKEAPDTLLLAEAFWLMEGYFVRTLGMHRVYNSAFMNMLKLEENQKYRQTIKNVLEFSPAVLQRFVNFMSNPDEECAEAQFGKGDKYFGVCMMMITMPGLPMFGHGQIEGYTEKYGMEYRRAYRDETPDEWLVARHEAELFPVMRQRHVFSGATHFRIYDLNRPEGGVDENVFAYSNRNDGQRGLVLFNNAFHETRGTIHMASAVNVGSAEAQDLRRENIAEALALNCDPATYYVFRDARSGLEYLHHVDEFKNGLYVKLGGYEYRALLDWREIHDFDNSWGKLHAFLGGRGAPSMDDAYCEMLLEPILEPFRALISAKHLRILAAEEIGAADEEVIETAFLNFIDALGEKLSRELDGAALFKKVRTDLDTVRKGKAAVAKVIDGGAFGEELRAYIAAGLPAVADKDADEAEEADAHLAFWRVPLAWSLVRHIGAAAAPAETNGFDTEAATAEWMREWFLTKQIQRAFRDLDQDDWRAGIDAAVVRGCVAYGAPLMKLQQDVWAPLLNAFFNDPDICHALSVNRYRGRRYLRQEHLDRLLHMLLLTQALARAADGGDATEPLLEGLECVAAMREAAADTGYDVDALVECLK